MRCFVALDLPDPVRLHLARVTQPLRERFAVRWVPAAKMHVTLLFAPDLTPDAVFELEQAVRDVELPALSLRLDRLAHFPPRAVPRIVVAALGGDVAPLTRLHDDLADRAAGFGVARDRRGFTPHVTLGRVTSDFGALALVDALRRESASLRPKPFAPTDLTLYASELGPAGPVHDALVRRRCAGLHRND